jgi:hypothetical protein
MQGKVNKRDGAGEEPEVSEQFSEAIAAYLEQRNDENNSNVAFEAAENDPELRRAVALFKVTERAENDQPDVNSAWQKFKAQAFVPVAQTVAVEGSLGYYVAEALATGEAEKATGVPREALEALRQDETPLTELKDFELADYAALAKRHGVKDPVFPRMLKWLKGLGKNFAAPSFGGSNFAAGMTFARQEDYEMRVSEAHLAQELERSKSPEQTEQEQQEDQQKKEE